MRLLLIALARLVRPLLAVGLFAEDNEVHITGQASPVISSRCRHGETGDPDEAMLTGAIAHQTVAKVKDALGTGAPPPPAS